MGLTVWLVEKGYDYEGYDVVGAYATEDLALRRIALAAREGTCSAKWKHYAVDVQSEVSDD